MQVKSIEVIGLSKKSNPQENQTGNFLGRAALVALLPLLILALRYHRHWAEEFNPDEGFILSESITLEVSPQYWKSVDGTTHGPLIPFFLNFAHRFGFPLNYSTAHSVSSLLIATTLIFLFLACRQFAPFGISWLAAASLIPYFGLPNDSDYLAYNAEQPSLFLLSLAVLFLVLALKSTHKKTFSFLLGAIVVLVPLAKPQAGPLGALIGLIFLTFNLLRFSRSKNSDSSLLRIGSSFIGGIAVLLGLGIYLYWNQSGSDFWNEFIVGNIRYAGQYPSSFWGKTYIWGVLFSRWTDKQQIPYLSLGWLPIGFAFLFKIRNSLDQTSRWLASYLALNLPLAAAVVILPNIAFDHYFLFWVWAFCWANAFCLVLSWKELQTSRAKWILTVLFSLLVAVGPLAQKLGNHRFRHYQDLSFPNPTQTGLKAAAAILRLAKPGDQMIVWGFMPRLYVFTGLPQATLVGATNWEIKRNPYYYKIFLRNLRESHAKFFVDAVGPESFAFTDRIRFAHEKYPEVEAWVRQNYQLMTEVESIRIYRLQ